MSRGYAFVVEGLGSHPADTGGIGPLPLRPLRPMHDAVEMTLLVGRQALEHLRQRGIALLPHPRRDLGIASRRLLFHRRRNREQLLQGFH